LGIPTNLKSI